MARVDEGPGSPAKRRDFSTAQLTLIRRTVARACTDAEFDEFIAVAAQCGLDPMRRQITPLILEPHDLERRHMATWTTIDGLRVIAARQGDYRPMETPPAIECDDARADPDRNPLGIVRAEVRAWKHRDGVWHPVAGEAWWDEYAPLREEWASDDNGARKPTGKRILDPSWARMGRLMIAKSAEAQALRRGWPDILSGLYGQEELQALRLADATASEVLAQRDRLHAAPKVDALWLIFDPNAALETVPRSEIGARLRAFYATASTADIAAFHERNKLSLKTYWDWEPAEAFAAKQLAETRLEEPAGKQKGRRARRKRSAPVRAPAPSQVSEARSNG